MNKTLLLIICDFLLLNLLALTRWDSQEPQTLQPASQSLALSQAARTVHDDLTDSLKSALEEERAQRDILTAQSRSNLAARDLVVKGYEEERRLMETNLSKSQLSALELSQKLAASAQTAAQTQQRLAEVQSRLTEAERAKAAAADSLRAAEMEQRRLTESLAGDRSLIQRQQEQMTNLDKARRDAEQKAVDLGTAVKVAEAEKGLLKENVADLKQQVGRVEKEKDRLQTQAATLATGVTQLAERSQELTKEFRESIPVNANLLFNDFLSNRVQVAVSGVMPGLFGSAAKHKETMTVVITDGVRTGALLHLSEAGLVFSNPGFGMDSLTARVTGRGTTLADGTVELLAADPRAVLVALDPGAVLRSGVRVFPLAKNPFKFTEAVLVTRGGKYYGEVEFRLDPRTPNHVRMKTRILSRLFGEFSPSAGDLVLSKTGEVLGVMVNGEYCVILKNLETASGGALVPTMGRAAMGRRLEEFKGWQDRLPGPLQ